MNVCLEELATRLPFESYGYEQTTSAFQWVDFEHSTHPYVLTVTPNGVATLSDTSEPEILERTDCRDVECLLVTIVDWMQDYQ